MAELLLNGVKHHKPNVCAIYRCLNSTYEIKTTQLILNYRKGVHDVKQYSLILHQSLYIQIYKMYIYIKQVVDVYTLH